ncbi:MAG: sigma-54 dependent transcriptional regulator [Bacteroidota bacterium]|nr:sigma-54 dependent transcriptional regulator [Bacteroidota bacterium]
MTPQGPLHQYIARSAVMRALLERVQTVARSDSTVLLIGETGVGKEVMAEYIHRHSQRNNRPFVKVGLATLPPELIESEIFGHEKGAYTSAVAEKKGLFELADTGTIFLDDIDDFPLTLQPKLLRVLESGEVQHVGSTRPIPIDIRVICATKVDLLDLADRGLFRHDLYYRINVVPIVIPPLRERREDIPILIDHFLSRYAPDRSITFADGAFEKLMAYPWPGNVRELRNVIQRICLFYRDTVRITDLPDEIRSPQPAREAFKQCLNCLSGGGMSFDEAISCLEYNLLNYAITQTRGNKSKAAQLLGMNLSTFRDKLAKHRLHYPGRQQQKSS